MIPFAAPSRFSLLGALALCISGCCRDYSARPTYVATSGDICCSTHNTPLVTSIAYWTPTPVLYDPTPEFAKVLRCNPNHIPEAFRLEKSEFYPIRNEVTYCILCEEKVRTFLASE